MPRRVVNSLVSRYVSKYISNQKEGCNQQIRKKNQNSYFRASTNKEEWKEALRSEIKYSAKSLITPDHSWTDDWCSQKKEEHIGNDLTELEFEAVNKMWMFHHIWFIHRFIQYSFNIHLLGII